jgi:hypothetical protein
MARSVEQQIADTKKRLAAAKKAAAKAAIDAKDSKASKEVIAEADNLRKYIASLEQSLKEYIGNAQTFITKSARGDSLSVLEKDEFDNIQKNITKINGAISSTRDKITAINMPGAKPATAPTNQTVMEKPTTLTAAKPTSTTSPKLGTTSNKTTTSSSTSSSSNNKTTGTPVPSGFNVGTFRQADEVSMAAANKITPTAGTGVKTPLDTLLAKTEFWYDLPDYIFKLDTKLGDLLVQAVAEGWDDAKFLSKAKLTPWWQKNAETVRTKIVERAKYDELKAAGEDVKNTEYGMYLGKQMRAVKAKAKELANVTLTDEQAQAVAQKIYDGNLEDDPLAINALIVPFIGRTTSIVGNGLSTTGFGGQALQNYQTLQGIAKANGFSLKDILPNISAITAGGDLETAVLRGLADGSIDINRVAQDARMLASQGQPQYVRNLLNQGYDLEAVYAPYRQTMAATLELDPNTIDLNDPTLRSAITDKGDINLYDFKKNLRRDNRWQYTSDAREEVGNSALKVLQDFGFQG